MRKKGRGELVRAGDLFEVYKRKLRAPQGTVVTAFKELVEDIFGVGISSKSISYTPASRTLSVTAAGPVKSEILLRKKELLTHLTARLGKESAPKDII